MKTIFLSGVIIFALSSSLEAGPFDDLKEGLKDFKEEIENITETSQQDNTKNLPRCDLPFSKEGRPETGCGEGVECKGQMIDGYVHVFYPSGQLNRKGQRLNEQGEPDMDGSAIGEWIRYDENCKLENKSFYKNTSDGRTEYITWYNPNGSINNEGGWDAKGNQSGMWMYYNEEGTKIDKGPWKDGKQHGVWEYYNKDGSLNKTLEWEKGENVTAKKGKEIENLISSAEMIPFIEACQEAYLMKREDAQRMLNEIQKNVRDAIDQGKLSSDKVNNAIDKTQMQVDMMGGFGYEQIEMCDIITVLSVQLKKPKKRF